MSLLSVIVVVSGFAQNSDTLTLEKAVQLALENHPSVKAAMLKIEREEKLKKSAINFEKMDVSYSRGEINSSVIDYGFEVSQGIKFPYAYVTQSKLQNEKILLSESAFRVTAAQLEKNVRSTWLQLAYAEQKFKLFEELETLYSSFAKVANKRFQAGETNILEKTTAIGQFQQVQLNKLQALADVKIAQQQLQQWLGDKVQTPMPENPLGRMDALTTDSASVSGNALLEYYGQAISVLQQEHKTTNSAFLPDLKARYFNQQIDGIPGFSGFKVGMSVPLFFWAAKGKSQAAKLNTEIAQAEYEKRMRITTMEYLTT